MGKDPKVPEGEQPEALESLEAAARSGGVKPSGQGLTATPETAPKPDDPERENRAATEILEAGVEKDPHKMTEVVQKSKDPRIP